jgi:hypothetical protein
LARVVGRGRWATLARHPMRRKSPRLLLAPIATALTLCGCGHAGAGHPPTASDVPLVGGAKIVSSSQQCDRGANAYCALELVIVDPRYPSSADLLKSEHRHLNAGGWTDTGGDTGQELAANSPTHPIRLTYATADGDLRGVDLGWIQRSRETALALSQIIFDRAPAISLMLESSSS